MLNVNLNEIDGMKRYEVLGFAILTGIGAIMRVIHFMYRKKYKLTRVSVL
jgi:hypothetical protein